MSCTMVTARQVRSTRSFLFVPASNERLLSKAPTSQADAIILDLEDGVSAPDKPIARSNLLAHSSALAEAGKVVVVRINAEPEAEAADIRALADAPVDAVIVPKLESREQADRIGDRLRSPGAGRQTGIVGLIETPLGLRRLDMIAQAEALVGFALGSEDLAACMGVRPTPALLDLPCREIALAAAAYGIGGIGLPFSIAQFEDATGTETAARLARAYGGTGALCVHPRQVVIVNAAFSPADEQREWAARVLAAWNERNGEVKGVAVMDGAMIDAPVLLLARRILGEE